MIQKYLSLVKFSHSVFALPFALIGYAMGTLAVGFSLRTLVGVVLCMVLARTAAMAFNRLVDRRFDAANPRTASREIPAGKVSIRAARWLVAGSSIGFMVVAAGFNTLTLGLSPVALAVILGYSYTKRFTWLCHLILGVGLGIAPSAAYIATTGTLSAPIGVLSILVWSWVSGFDIIFALQDEAFDRSQGLHSLPARFGIRRALGVSIALHVVTAAMVVLLGWMIGGNAVYWTGAGLFGCLLTYQHLIVRPSDLSRVNLAFGTTNGLASIIYAIFVITSILI